MAKDDHVEKTQDVDHIRKFGEVRKMMLYKRCEAIINSFSNSE